MRDTAVTALVLASLVACGMTFGQECLQPVGWWAYQETNSVAVSGSTAYFGGVSADGQSPAKLMVADVSNTTYPALIGALDLPGASIEDIAVTPTSLCLLASGDAGLQVVDVSNPAAPALVGSLDTPGYARAVAVGGSVAVVADDSAGLRLIAFSASSPPHEVGAWEAHVAHDVATDGTYAYVAAGTSGLHVLDIANPSTPVEVGSLALATDHVALAGSYAYTLQHSPPLMRVVDISNPTSPKEVGFYSSFYSVRDLAVADSLVFVVGPWADNLTGRLVVIDVSDPSTPVHLATAVTAGDRPNHIAATATRVYIADRMGLRLFDVSQPSSPLLTGAYLSRAIVRGIAACGSYAYLAASYGLLVVDVSVPSRPLPIVFHEHSYNGNYNGVTLRGPLLYVADNLGLFVLDVTVPTAPVVLGFSPTVYAAVSVTVEGSTAYVAARQSGLRIVDVSDPSSPLEVGFFDTPGDASQVAVAGSLAFVADSSWGVRVVDVSAPSAPFEIGWYDTPGQAWGVALDGDHAYVAYDDILRVLDVSDPSAPVEVGSFPTGAFRVTIAGSLAYVSGLVGLRVLDVSDPTTPVEVGVFQPSSDTVLEVAIGGAYLYVPGYDHGFHVLTRCELFADGFECGSTANWAATLPYGQRLQRRARPPRRWCARP